MVLTVFNLNSEEDKHTKQKHHLKNNTNDSLKTFRVCFLVLKIDVVFQEEKQYFLINFNDFAFTIYKRTKKTKQIIISALIRN
jgi:penicillin-binding protein-related factor A (putative recombinase)